MNSDRYIGSLLSQQVIIQNYKSYSGAMEVIVPEVTAPSNLEHVESTAVIKTSDAFEISSNWSVAWGKNLRDTVTTVLHKDFSGR